MSSTFFFVRCPTGDAEFPVDPAKVPQGGIHARCSVCSTVFLVEVPGGTGGAQAGGGGLGERREGESRLEDAGAVLVDGEAVGEVVEGAADGWSAGPLPEESEEPDEGPGAEPDEEPDPVDDEEDPSPPAGSEGDQGETSGDDRPERVGIEVQAFGWPELDRSREPAGDRPPSAPERPAGREEKGIRLEVDIPSSPPDSGGAAFGRRDPHDKARRLSRVLVSDMITYHRERHTRALEAGTLPEDFDEEIRRSWDEYVLQVGREIAEETPYFRDALNEILAGGRELF